MTLTNGYTRTHKTNIATLFLNTTIKGKEVTIIKVGGFNHQQNIKVLSKTWRAALRQSIYS